MGQPPPAVNFSTVSSCPIYPKKLGLLPAHLQESECADFYLTDDEFLQTFPKRDFAWLDDRTIVVGIVLSNGQFFSGRMKYGFRETIARLKRDESKEDKTLVRI